MHHNNQQAAGRARQVPIKHNQATESSLPQAQWGASITRSGGFANEVAYNLGKFVFLNLN